MQCVEGGKPLLFIGGNGRGEHLVGKLGDQLGDLREGIGERGHDGVGTGFAQAIRGFGEFFDGVPKTDDDLPLLRVCPFICFRRRTAQARAGGIRGEA